MCNTAGKIHSLPAVPQIHVMGSSKVSQKKGWAPRPIFLNPPPPPKMKIWADLGTLSLNELVWSTPIPLPIPPIPPKKWKFGQILALWVWMNWSEVPPSPSPSLPLTPQNENLGRFWHFEFELVWSTPPANENLGRSWHFELVWSTPPPLRKWNSGQLVWRSCVKTNHCIPRGYHLVQPVLCVGLAGCQ